MKLSTMNRYNDWWITGHPRKTLLMPYRRPVFNKIMEYIDNRQILLLYGLRRVGKTTLIYQIIEELLSRGVQPKHILYFSFDESEIEIDTLIQTYEAELLKSPIMNVEKVYLILDEVQKGKDWENRIKIYYDLYPNIKFIISGSASLNIKKKSSETLAGRLYSFHINPLNFAEFLGLKGIHIEFNEWRIYENTVKPLLMDYIVKGGFPELVNEEKEEKILSYVKEIVLDRIVLIDIPWEFGVRDTALLKMLIEMIASDPGLILNYDSLSKKIGKSKQTLINYIFYLEYSLIIKTIKNLRPGFIATSRKMRKVYFTNSAFQFAIHGSMYENLGKVAENAVLQAAGPDNYYRDGSEEIDFLLNLKGKIIPIEVKSGAYELNKFVNLTRKLGLSYGIIISKDDYAIHDKDGVRVHVIPLWLFLLYYDRIEDIE
ncbi:MAG: ATP-binding protein [Thermoplasmataceae archaeon]